MQLLVAATEKEESLPAQAQAPSLVVAARMVPELERKLYAASTQHTHYKSKHSRWHGAFKTARQ